MRKSNTDTRHKRFDHWRHNRQDGHFNITPVCCLLLCRKPQRRTQYLHTDRRQALTEILSLTKVEPRIHSVIYIRFWADFWLENSALKREAMVDGGCTHLIWMTIRRQVILDSHRRWWRHEGEGNTQEIRWRIAEALENRRVILLYKRGQNVCSQGVCFYLWGDEVLIGDRCRWSILCRRCSLWLAVVEPGKSLTTV